MVFSAVRCNARGNVGFLANLRRMNVAITRAKHGLIIVGHTKTLSKNKHWKIVVKYFKEKKCFVTGLDNAKELIKDRIEEKNSLGLM